MVKKTATSPAFITQKVTVTCPVCQNTEFGVHNGREMAGCTRCKALERGRYLWLVLQRHIMPQPHCRVAHFAPERFLMDFFYRLSPSGYEAYDLEPHRYKHPHVNVCEFDMCKSLPFLDTDAYDIIIHNHVLEHLPCSIDKILMQLYRMLKPGGHMLFSVPFRGDRTEEDLSPDLSPEERKTRFAQEDHVRIFGKVDFLKQLTALFGSDCLIRQNEFSNEAELEFYGIPYAGNSEPNGSSLFIVTKPQL